MQSRTIRLRFSTCFVDAVKVKNQRDEMIVWQLRDALGVKALLFHSYSSLHVDVKLATRRVSDQKTKPGIKIQTSSRL